jgi:hypothetical protein
VVNSVASSISSSTSVGAGFDEVSIKLTVLSVASECFVVVAWVALSIKVLLRTFAFGLSLVSAADGIGDDSVVTLLLELLLVAVVGVLGAAGLGAKRCRRGLFGTCYLPWGSTSSCSGHSHHHHRSQ